MIPYFLLVLIPIIISIWGQKYRINIGKHTIYKTRCVSIDGFMLIFILLLAMRGLQCGTDTRQYEILYDEYNSYSILELFDRYNQELGYKVLNKLIGIITNSFQSFLFVTSIICVCPLWYFYKNESEHAILTIALFLTVAPFMMYFSGIKQAVAMAFAIPAWYAAKNKKRILFLITVFGAMQFHSSAFILVLIYPLYYAQITKKWIWGIIPCMIAIYVFRIPIFNFLITFLWQKYTTTPETGATTILILLILFGIYVYVIPDESILERDTIAMRNLLLLSIAIQCFAPVHPLAMRMNYYFLIFIPILITKIVYRSKKEFVEIAKISVIVMNSYFIYYFVRMVISGNSNWNIFPYIPFWTT